MWAEEIDLFESAKQVCRIMLKTDSYIVLVFVEWQTKAENIIIIIIIMSFSKFKC